MTNTTFVLPTFGRSQSLQDLGTLLLEIIIVFVMHEAAISTHTLEQPALRLQEHGLKVEQWGKRLQERSDQLALEHGQLIEQCGKVIQQKAEEALVYTQAAQAQKDDSPELMRLITHTQLEARAAYIQAITIFAGMMQKRTKLVGKHL